MTGEKLSAEFCKSPNSDTDSENIQLGNLTKVSHGVIHMHESYGNESFTLCTVTFKGNGNGVIIFNHQRQNVTQGACLINRTIDDTIYSGPCSKQRVSFSSMTKITLIKAKHVQPSFVIYFKGMFERKCLTFDNTSHYYKSRVIVAGSPTNSIGYRWSHFAFRLVGL